jgi:hypothetical protein
MDVRKENLNKIIEEELSELIRSKEIDEGFFDKIKDFGRKGFNYLTKPRPEASAGVGRAMAQYRLQNKGTAPSKQTAPKQTALALTPHQDSDEVEGEFTSTTRRIKDIGQLSGVNNLKGLPPHTEPPKPINPQNRLEPHKEKKPLMLGEPGEIVTSPEIGVTVQPDDITTVSRLMNKYVVDLPKIPKEHVNMVIGYLMSNNRILVNPTRVPKGPKIQDAEVVAENIKLQSMQQADLNVDSLDSWIFKLHKSFKQDRNIDIPVINIYAIVMAVYNDGRLAISPQRARRMGVEIQNKNIKTESISYQSYYDSWKQHTRTGVTI